MSTALIIDPNPERGERLRGILEFLEYEVVLVVDPGDWKSACRWFDSAPGHQSNQRLTHLLSRIFNHLGDTRPSGHVLLCPTASGIVQCQ